MARGFLGQLGKYLVSLSTARVTSHTPHQFPLIIITTRRAGPAELNIFALFHLKYFCKSGRLEAPCSGAKVAEGEPGSNQETVSDLITRLGNKAMISISSHKVTNSPNITHSYSSPRLDCIRRILKFNLNYIVVS